MADDFLVRYYSPVVIVMRTQNERVLIISYIIYDNLL